MPYRTDGSSALAPDEGDFSGDSALDDSWTAQAAGSTGGESGAGGNIIQFPGGRNDDDAALKHARREAAREKALGGEKSASGAGDDLSGKNGNGVDAAKGAEGAGSNVIPFPGGKDADDKKGGFKNSVAGKAAAKGVPGGGIVVEKLKKLGPFGTVLIMMGICLGVFSASASLAPFGLINNLMDSFNVYRTSSNMRSKYLTKRLINANDGKHTKIVKTKIFSPDKFKISKSMQKKLRSQGVYYDLDNRILVYTDPETGKTYGVSADERGKSSIPDSVDVDDGMGGTKHFDIDPNGKMAYEDMLDIDDGFFTAMEKGTRTIKGHIAGWFDSVSENFHKRIGNPRNRQKDTSDGADDAEIEEHARRDGMAEDDASSKNDVNTGDEKQVDDGEGGKKTIIEETPARNNTDDGFDTAGNDASLKKGMSNVEVEHALSARAKTAAATFGKAAKIGNLATLGCAGLKILNSLITTIVALVRAGVLNWGTGLFEAIQKAMAGDSSTELMFYINKMMMENENGESAWSSAGVNQHFADGSVIVGRDNDYVKELNTSSLSTDLLGAAGSGTIGGKVLDGIQEMGGSLAAYKGCIQLGFLAAGAGIAADLLEVLAVIPSGGLSVIFGKLFEGFTKKLALAAIIAGITTFVTSVLVPKVAKTLARDLIGEETIGPILGFATDSAANMYMGQQMKAASGTPGTATTVAEQYQMTQEVIASEARYIRNTHSPFDITTKYTFFGSIVNSVTPIAMSLKSPLSVVSNVTSLVGSSVNSLLPTVAATSAIGIETSMTTDCGSYSQVDSAGEPLVCDAYGNPYYVTYKDTMGVHPVDVMDAVALDENGGRNFEDEAYEEGNEENPQIRELSEMAKWEVSCLLSDGDAGKEDPMVSAYVHGKSGSTVETIGETLIGVIPIIGDGYDMADQAIEAANMGWITHENCADPKYKYYARYAEDQKWMENAGILEESAITAFANRYYEQYPMDTSFEGMIARFSSQTKEEVELAFGVMEYSVYLANNVPSPEMMPSGEAVKEYKYVYDGEIVDGDLPAVLSVKYVVYDTLRDRVKIA